MELGEKKRRISQPYCALERATDALKRILPTQQQYVSSSARCTSFSQLAERAKERQKETKKTLFIILFSSLLLQATGLS
ncbi:non-ribosomal peptide synthetase [Sesbania bispinosa]|nr:non-ribosomal peptide synthetase [Sesbania bispinosa]